MEFPKPSGLTVTYEVHLEASNSHLMNARPNQNKIIHSLATKLSQRVRFKFGFFYVNLFFSMFQLNGLLLMSFP